MKGGQGWSRVEDKRIEVVARYATLEQAERNPRGYVQYPARPAERPSGER